MLCECGCGEETPLARTNQNGYRKGDPLRFVPEHRNRRGPRWVEEDRGYVTPCHIWQGWTGKGGYGRVRRAGRKVLAHVVAWEAVHGPVPDGLTMDHLCRQPACVRVDHLEAVTLAENIRRSPRTKLTVAAVRAIRASVAVAHVEAERYGVSESAIAAVRSGRTWREVV